MKGGRLIKPPVNSTPPHERFDEGIDLKWRYGDSGFMKDDEYHTNIYCNNCGHYTSVYIKKGTTAGALRGRVKCSRCGC